MIRRIIYLIVGISAILTITACMQMTKNSGSGATDGMGKNYNQPKVSYRIDTESRDDIWQSLRSSFQLNHEETNPLVKSQLRWFQTHPKYFTNVGERAKPYLYHIMREVQRRRLPGELVLIPMLESAYNPFVYSPSGAAGLWQIMPGTATTLGLKSSWWYDGRRDLAASTDAALSYLAYLENFFNHDWNLAIVAYDAGEGTITNALKRSTTAGFGGDYWSLHLSAEARAYLPRLLAMAIIIENPEKYGIELPHIKNKPYFSQVNIGGQLDLANAAELADVSLEEIYLLNPAYSRWATDPNGPHQLLIPADKVGSFSRKLAQLPAMDRMRWERYEVRRGDSLALLAKRFGTTVAIIKEVNHLAGEMLRERQALFIPSSKHMLPSHSRFLALYRAQDSLVRKKVVLQPTKTVYTIKSGDNLWTIAHKHNVKVDRLRQWNKLPAKQAITPGTNLVIWKKVEKQITTTASRHPTQASHPETTVNYTVKNGDSLSELAHRYHTTAASIKRQNHLTSDLLRPGHQLQITQKPAAAAKQTVAHTQAQSTKSQIYTVKEGDTLSQIAHDHHTKVALIKQLNQLHTTTLRQGQQIRVK